MQKTPDLEPHRACTGQMGSQSAHAPSWSDLLSALGISQDAWAKAMAHADSEATAETATGNPKESPAAYIT